ncbi:hypothetical protein [Kitasatospora sp. NPDC058478]|uniref:hypothetical protein n=1 Tax=unclassified Kitasatospora TaxID=2633591 RepID=UPI0036624889
MAENIGARLAGLEQRLSRLEASPRLQHSSIEGGAVNIYDKTGSLKGILGQQLDGTTGLTVTNGPTPPTPAAPTVSPALAGLTIAWTGQWQNGTTPLDFSRVEVHIGTSSAFTPTQATMVGTIETPQGGLVTVPLDYGQWWVRLRARTTSGVAGPATAAAAGTPRRAGGADIEADAINGRTITGVTLTGSTVQTAASGRRVVLTPTDPVTGNPNPATALFSGAAVEKAPARLTASVVGQDGQPLTPATLLSSPQLTDGGLNSANLQLGAGIPGTTGYAARAGFSLEALGALGLNGQTTIYGSAGAGDSEGYIQLFIRGKDKPTKHGMLYLDLGRFEVDLADDSRLSYTVDDGLFINSPMKIQGGDLTLGGGTNLVISSYQKITNNEAWTDITFNTPYDNASADGTTYRKVQVRRQIDGTVALRGVAKVPTTFTNGVIGTLPANYAPPVDETFRAATSGSVGSLVTIRKDGRIEITSSGAISSGLISFSRLVWDLT